MLIFILMIVILTATLPVEAQQADKGLPEPGTRWVARVASPAGVNTLRLTAVGEDLYKGKPVYHVSVEEGGKEGVFFYDHATANPIAITREGREESVSLPHEGTFVWPLRLGKSWTAKFTYYDRLHPNGTPVEINWVVQAYEEVQVPGGTWKAFRLRGSSPAGTTFIWYAPRINLMVRRVFERGLFLDHPLGPDHPLGHARVVTEIIEYPAK